MNFNWKTNSTTDHVQNVNGDFIIQYNMDGVSRKSNYHCKADRFSI